MIIEAVRGLDVDELLEPSELEGWSRLTILCHLRYGASALLRMTRDTLAGRATAYYPDGRSAQRPGTLEPLPGETGGDVIESLAAYAEELDAGWARPFGQAFSRAFPGP